MVTHNNNDDTQLNAVLAAWQAPPPSPWLAARVSERIIAAQKAERAALLPWSPFKLVAATAAAVLVGVFIGLAMPTAEASADTTDMIELLW